MCKKKKILILQRQETKQRFLGDKPFSCSFSSVISADIACVIHDAMLPLDFRFGPSRAGYFPVHEWIQEDYFKRQHQQTLNIILRKKLKFLQTYKILNTNLCQVNVTETCLCFHATEIEPMSDPEPAFLLDCDTQLLLIGTSSHLF